MSKQPEHKVAADLSHKFRALDDDEKQRLTKKALVANEAVAAGNPRPLQGDLTRPRPDLARCLETVQLLSVEQMAVLSNDCMWDHLRALRHGRRREATRLREQKARDLHIMSSYYTSGAGSQCQAQTLEAIPSIAPAGSAHSVRAVPVGMSQLEVYDATYDSRKDAAEMLKAKAHGNQHVSRLQNAAARVWAHMMNTIQDKPVDAVLAPEAAPPKPQDMMCLQARRCLCNVQGRMECVLRDRLHHAIKAAFPQTLRRRLKNADVVACLFKDVPEEDTAAECTSMHIADCIFSPFMPGYHELCVADAALVYMRRDGVDPSLLAVEDDSSFELTSCFREHTDWEVVHGALSL